MTVILAAPDAVPGIVGGQLFGAITVTGLAFASWVAFILGIRGSDRIKLNTRDRVAWSGIVTGTLSVAAGGTWADVVNGIASIPQSAIGSASDLGDPGLGGTAVILTLLAFGPRWKRLLWPGLLGIAAAVVYGTAGGVWGILVTIIRMVVGQITGAQ